jgi:type II secretory pathway component PulF
VVSPFSLSPGEARIMRNYHDAFTLPVPFFPDIIPNMVRVGEESGTLPEVLNELHHFMSQRFLAKTKKYMNLLEPLVIIFIALFIGLLIMSIIPIIMNISDISF